MVNQTDSDNFPPLGAASSRRPRSAASAFSASSASSTSSASAHAEGAHETHKRLRGEAMRWSAASLDDRERKSVFSGDIPGLGVVVPGQQIVVEEGCMRGHGTYEKGGKIFAAVCGILEKVNKLVYIRPLRSRYQGSVGDVVVGRVTDILNGKWLVDVNSGQAACLALAAISLPEHRRRLDEDMLEMQNFFVVGDVICCEVQRVRADGQILLHTRSTRYGRLMNGVFLAVAPQQIQRQSHHIVQLSCGVQVVLGLNGYIWISLPMKTSAKDTMNYAHVQTTHEKVSKEMRLAISRVRNIVLCLARSNFDISTQTIERMYDVSVSRGWEAKDLADPLVMQELVEAFLVARLGKDA
ncbi:exosome component 2, putative [Toxoplasma gondii ME49]|uniref:Exosome component 2, putative n=2 Tax=Toxoplasma gondii TaxID=5811 RepID=S8G5N6_TOXGM|nr:exosome component 2, putative [Toxoplasma gondii ME49]EPT26985.1 exosome component 2, putative [Toxoplasma gondii ME49]|eukprot:XP_002366160.1 exosome component 2, putative [Toxoplasma gondii ME49]